MGNDFSNAKVGDKVWDSRRGWGTIVEINIIPDNPEAYPIVVNINDCYNLYTTKGYDHKNDINPVLFWDEIKIVPPPKPKRKVEKIIEGWINIYRNRTGNDELVATSYSLYKSLEIADKNAQKDERLGNACKIIHKYTIEE